MDYYYFLKSGEAVVSKWDHQVGARYKDSEITHVITKAEYEQVIAHQQKQNRKARSRAKKEVDLWFAGTILKSGMNCGIDIKDTLTVMRDLAPSSFNELEKALKP